MGVDKLKLLMGRPIVISQEHDIKVHQPKINIIVDYGESEFGDMALPFIITTESVFNGLENEEELISKYHIFELFFVKIDEEKNLLDSVFGGRSSLEVLKNSLEFFLQTDNIRILENRMKVLINDSYIMGNEEFDTIRKAIQAVTNRKDVEVEKPPKNMTKRQKDIWLKLQKGRKRTAERNAIYLQDIINFVSFGGSSYISTEQIDNMTYYYLHNAYKSIVGIDTYNISMQYKLSQKYDVKDEIKHWTETLKIGK